MKQINIMKMVSTIYKLQSAVREVYNCYAVLYFIYNYTAYSIQHLNFECNHTRIYNLN